MFCLSRAAYVLWLFGYPEQAVKRSQEALALAQELAHSNTLAAALSFASWFYQLCREGQRAKERAEAAITLSTEQGLPFWLAQGSHAAAGCWPNRDKERKGLRRYARGWPPTGLREQRYSGAFSLLSLLAEVYGKVGQTEEGLSVLAEALDGYEQT